jgi:hypothetical protein
MAATASSTPPFSKPSARASTLPPSPERNLALNPISLPRSLQRTLVRQLFLRQYRPARLSLQGALMNRKRMLSDFLIYAGMIFACFLFLEWNKSVSNYGTDVLVENLLAALAISLGIAGYQGLDRCGHVKIRRVLRNSLFVWFGIYLVLFAVVFFSKTTAFDFAFSYSLYPLLLLIVAPFPLALYVDKNKHKSGPEPTSTSAS